jgi:DNA-directed RNA polymerase specialized sigma24 family protein
VGQLVSRQHQDRHTQAQGVARDRRDQVDLLVALATHLPPDERSLIDAVYERGLRPVDVARVTQARPQAIRNRLQRIVRRLGSPMFRFVAARREGWPRQVQAVADLVVLQGVSQREAARRLDVSIHRVRQEVMRLRVLSEKERI